MPLDPAHPGRSVNMNDAPGGDLSFDDLFPIEDGSQPQPQAVEGTNPPASVPQAPVQMPSQPEPFLKAGSSIYNTAEDAARGLEYKDSVIEQLRQYAVEKTGFDPLTKKPTSQPSQPQAQPGFQYLGNGKRLYDDLSSAVERRDPDAYERTMRAYQSELLNATIGPAAPLLGEVARQKAIRQISGEIKDFESYVSSQDYRETLEAMPTLKQAIDIAENDFSQAGRLGELYRLVYFAGQGRRLQAQPPVAPAVQTPPAARPTMTPSTMTPPSPSAPPDLRTSEGRKQLIRDMEARGILDKNL